MSASIGDLTFDKVLFFTPHPDDAEITDGGTIAGWAVQGVDIVICVVTNGACGSNDPSVERDELIATRQSEQRRAGAILGVSQVVFLGHEDGLVQDSHALRTDMIREIRRHRPDVVVGPDPSTYWVDQWYVNHPDHRAVGAAVLAAVYPGASTLPLYRTELLE